MNRALDAYALRQQTHSKNIANATSPHYRPERVKFEELFHKQAAVMKGSKSDDNHMPIGVGSNEDIKGEKHPQHVPEAEIFFSGETHVNIDKEMSYMAQNQIRFKFGSSMANRFFGGISNSISGIVK